MAHTMMTHKTPIAVCISGSGSNLQALIDACALPDYPAEIVLVVSNKAGVRGLERAAQAGIPALVIDHTTYESREAFDAVLHEALLGSGAEIVCLAGFMRILTAEFVAKWEGRMLNIHPSLLPKYKGLHTHQRAIEAGDAVAGCTVHLVTAEMDEGPILAQAEVPVMPDDTPETLAARVLVQEHVIYPQALQQVVEGLPR